ncbi:hypothetical protein DSO57_1013894 [Entomophthora muscae]|uniref:Uncharacterized protein n=1 Tax=Entomophthora muscae TaxID=34485 RepID=A0ACC2THB8_9FUNG|nr:hypothetical protein DSO57_1013894 [Entomophthora muscae]
MNHPFKYWPSPGKGVQNLQVGELPPENFLTYPLPFPINPWNKIPVRNWHAGAAKPAPQKFRQKGSSAPRRLSNRSCPGNLKLISNAPHIPG